ncbi:MAG: Crp/Fnr family transcriptional regulator [Clostridia bacterium]|nr:Crp/Fnr family transcriptional regulator [Clostridia bacterium]
METSDAKMLVTLPLFATCDVADLEKYDAVREEYETGREITLPRSSLGFLEKGKVRIRVRDGGSLMNEVGAGEIFGAATAFLCDETISMVTAATKCRILFISRDTLERIFAGHPSFAIAYIELLSEKILFLNKKVYALTSADSVGALAALIAEQSAGEDTVSMNLSATADRLSIGRATLYRAISTLKNDGLISVDGRNITILDRKGLISRREK